MYDKAEFYEKVNKEEVNSLFAHEETREKTEYKIIPDGTYIVEISNMCIGTTKTDKPALKVTFTITDGEFTNSKLFLTTVLTNTYTIHKSNEFLRSLQTGHEIVYNNLKQYTQDVEIMMTEIRGKYEYDLNHWTNAKGYKEFKIVGGYDVI